MDAQVVDNAVRGQPVRSAVVGPVQGDQPVAPVGHRDAPAVRRQDTDSLLTRRPASSSEVVNHAGASMTAAVAAVCRRDGRNGS